MLGEDIISPDILATTESGPSLVNIIIGKVSGDKEDHVYLVDLYPMKGDKNYYKKASLEKIKKRWDSLFGDLIGKTGGRYDFSLSRSALRKYLSVLEKWQSLER